MLSHHYACISKAKEMNMIWKVRYNDELQ